MYCKRTKSLFFFTIPFILSAVEDGCARARTSAIERLAVMPIENLSSDAQLDWGSRAAAAVVVYDLAGAKNVFARPVSSLSDAQSMQASRLVEGYFFVRNGRIGIRATVEDLARKKAVESWEIEGATAAGFLPVANKLARRLSPDARRFGTSDENAFRFYGEALTARDSKSAHQALQQAAGADPGFAAPYVEEAKLFAGTGDREGARRVVEAGGNARLDSIDRADLKYVGASASGNATDRIQALEALMAATPTNANIFRELGEIRFGRREFQPAAMEYRVAAQLDPESPQIWNQLAYALAWAKDLKGAREALAEYEKLAPGDVNVLDSQGEVSYMLGDFQSASEYFERAAAKNPQEWLKAAEARLMLGDLKGADEFFLKHLGPKGGRNAGPEYQMAQWEFLTGRRKAGMAHMEKLAAELKGDLQSLGLSQLAIWKLETGDRKAAGDLAKQAGEAAQSPLIQKMSAITGFIASGGTTSSGLKLVDADALLFARKYREALPLLQSAYAETNPSADGDIRTLLAWAYLETGAVDKAAGLVESTPLVLSFGEPQFTPPILPRYLYVRSAVLAQQGKKDEARKSQELYVKYAGATN